MMDIVIVKGAYLRMRPHDDDKKNSDQDNEEKKRNYTNEHKEHPVDETLTDRDLELSEEEGTNEEETYIDENIPPEEPPLEYFLNDEPDDEKTTKKKKKNEAVAENRNHFRLFLTRHSRGDCIISIFTAGSD